MKKKKLFGKQVALKIEAQRSKEHALHFEALVNGSDKIFERLKVLAKPYDFHSLDLFPYYMEQQIVVNATKILQGNKYACPVDITGFPVEPSDSMLKDLLEIMKGAFDRREVNLQELA